MQPTFAIDAPITSVKLQFLDQNDPQRDKIVRKKAREWVNRNRDIANQSSRQRGVPRGKSTFQDPDDVEENEMQVQRFGKDNEIVVFNSTRQFDPFNILPDVGRKYSHIVEFCKSETLLSSLVFV